MAQTISERLQTSLGIGRFAIPEFITTSGLVARIILNRGDASNKKEN